MKLIDGIKLKGRPAEIPDCSRDDLPQFFVDMGFKVGAEIGVYKGNYTKKFIDVGLKIFGVDPWIDYPDFNDEGDYDHEGTHSVFQAKFNILYEHAKQKIAPYPNAKIIRKTSMEAVQDFKSNSLDFVYIDGHHGFKYVAEDIWEWSKKVRVGGIISGHDYFVDKRRINGRYLLHVKFVVDAYTKAWGINNWYVLGRESPNVGEKRDRNRSWMWIKEYNEPSGLIEA